MKFEWDEAKLRANYKKHGLDFRDAEKILQGSTITAVDNRREYGTGRIDLFLWGCWRTW